MKVLCVVGTRPEVIKMAPVIRELRRYRDQVKAVVCVTGQHRELVNQMLDVFGIRPDFDLGLMKPNQSLSWLTSQLIERLDAVVSEVMPDWILAQGDTTTVLASALVAFYRRVSFGHVEAGLRSGDRHHPFPEEVNRRIADLVADLYFAPTERAREALLREGCPADRIFVTGNTVVDALLQVSGMPFSWSQSPLGRIPPEKRIVLVTAHRRESFGRAMREICLAIRDLAKRFESDRVQFVFPVHMNPNVRRPVQEILSGLENVSLLEPLDYVSFVNLMKRSYLILTDSGGIQEEAPTFGVPVLVMRDVTERPEAVEAGVAKLVGTKRESIRAEAARMLSDPARYRSMQATVNPFGDGKAAERIVRALLDGETRL